MVNFLDRLPPVLDKVKNLIASHNLIETIPKDFFNNTTDLNDVDFSHNQIQRIYDITFETLDNLETLNLSHNCIKSMETIKT